MGRFKLRFEFWLEPDKPEHMAVIEVIRSLKAERSYAPVVRDGIMIVAELRQGRADLLLRLFPWLEQYVLENIDEPERILPSNSDMDELRAEVEQLKSWIAASQQIVAEPAGPRAMSVPQVAAPPPDDDDDEITLDIKKADNDGVSSQNFLDSVFNLVQ